MNGRLKKPSAEVQFDNISKKYSAFNLSSEAILFLWCGQTDYQHRKPYVLYYFYLCISE